MIKKNITKIIILSCFFLFLQGETFVIDAKKNAVWHNNQGLYYLHDYYFDAAIAEFKIALILSHDTSASATFYNNLGLTYLKIGKLDWAAQSFAKAINLNPNFIEYYKNLVSVYKYKKSLNRVISKYKAYVAKDNQNSQAWLVLGLTYKELKRNDDAVKCFKEFVKLEPNLTVTQDIKDIIYKLSY